MGKRKNDRLTDLVVRQAKTRGLYADGGGLFLNIAQGGSKSWVFRYSTPRLPAKRWARQKSLGLGGYPTVSLDEAREEAQKYRLLRKKGIDPFKHREQERVAKEIKAAKTKTFMQVADMYMDSRAKSWVKYPRNIKLWQSRFATYVKPVFRDLPIGEIDTNLVLQVIAPIWDTKPDTASRIRGNIEAVIDYAKTKGYFEGENPARWKGHLANTLPSKRKVRLVKHCAALPYWQIPEFMHALRQVNDIRARRLEFCILTGTRTNETVGARWSEFDLAKGVWEIPASRMLKNTGENPHQIPLVGRALEILKEMPQDREFVFYAVAPHKRRSLNPNGFLKGLGNWRDKTGHPITVHGFRTSFRTWAAEQTRFAWEVCEAALSHTVGSEVSLAYQRGGLLDKRRELMREWDTFCSSKPAGNVVPMRAA